MLHKSTHMSAGKRQALLQQTNTPINRALLQKVTKACPSCNQLTPVGPLSKLQPSAVTVTTPLHRIHIDFIDMEEPKYISHEGHTCILTIRDNFSRWSLFTPMFTKKIAPVAAHLRLIMAITGHRIKFIRCDGVFKTRAFLKFAEEENISLEIRPMNVSRAVLVERAHRDVHEKIRAFCADTGNKWPDHLHKIVNSLNMQTHYLFFTVKT